MTGGGTSMENKRVMAENGVKYEYAAAIRNSTLQRGE
jgi:hypothetical protein